MQISLSDLDFLRSDLGQQWLMRVSASPLDKTNQLQWASKLRQTLPPAHAQAVLETVLLRQRARGKFSKAQSMYFDRAGLEMSSAELISTYRAQRFASYPRVADLGCGIGGDAIGLAAHSHVFAVDRDSVRLALTIANATAYGHQSQLNAVEADLETMSPFAVDALFFDPARRDNRGKRIFSLAHYRPPLTILDRWLPYTSNWGIKVSPGVKLSEIPQQASVEFISVNGELREAVLWYGDLRTAAKYKATLLPDSAQLASDAACDAPPISTPLRYLFEPDAAIIRAQLVQHVATRNGLAMLDPQIAYLTGDISAESPFLTQYKVEAFFPFQLKRLRSFLRERQVGRAIIKKRGSPLDPDQLRKQLKLKGRNARTIFLTRLAGQPSIIVCL